MTTINYPDTNNKSKGVLGTVTAKLKKGIVSGHFLPHSFLPPERVLAKQFETSRTTMRVALNKLADDGLIAISSRKGARVLPHSERLSKKIVGIVHSLSAETTFSSPAEPAQILAGIQDTFNQFGYPYELVSILNHDEPPKATHDDYGAMIFVETIGFVEEITKLEQKRVPVVVANLETNLDVSSTWVDHRKTSLAATNILIGFGHKRIAFLGRAPDCYFYGKAQEGYLAGLQNAGIAPDESLIATCENTDTLSAYLATKSLLDAPEPATAIVAARDILAAGACRAISETDLIIGRDISIIGFDDVAWKEGQSFLTTFREPCREMGKAAAKLIIDRVINGWSPVEKMEFEAPLVLRQSAGPLISQDNIIDGKSQHSANVDNLFVEHRKKGN